MNLFTGMSDHQIISVVLDFALFNGFVLLEAAALAAFYITSRPRRGRVRTAALFHIAAAAIFIMSLVSTVWAAPAQKAFISEDASESFFDLNAARFQKVIIGVIFAAVGIAVMAVGALTAARQRRAMADEALARA